MGDHNVDLLTQDNERNMLLDFCDAFDLKNIIQDTTCHVGDSNTLIDHIFTNKPRSCLTKGVLDSGVRDVHRLVCIVLPGIVNAYNPTTIYYRSFKYFDEDLFKVDIDIESSQIRPQLVIPIQGYLSLLKVCRTFVLCMLLSRKNCLLKFNYLS